MAPAFVSKPKAPASLPPALDEEDSWGAEFDAKSAVPASVTSAPEVVTAAPDAVPPPTAVPDPTQPTQPIQSTATATPNFAAPSDALAPAPLPEGTVQKSVASAPAPRKTTKENSEPVRLPTASSAGGTRIAWLAAAALAVAGAWFFLRPKGESTVAPAAREDTAAHQLATKLEPAAVPAPEATEASRDTNSIPVATASAAAAASNAPNKPESEPTAQQAPRASDLIVVTVTAIPPDARFFFRGKAVGRSPFRVELKPGERRSFEIGRPGFFARKVVVDGTRKEMTVSMRPEN